MKDHAYVEVSAKMATWQLCGIIVKEKQLYRVRAAGTWTLGGMTATDTGLECTAAGLEKRKDSVGPFMRGTLQGQVNGKTFPLGEDVTFIASDSGPLLLLQYESNEACRVNSKGALQVLIVAQ